MHLSKDLLIDEKMLFAVEKRIHRGNCTMNELHYHAHYEILHITDGARYLFINNRKYMLTKNCIALIPAYVPHFTGTDEITPQTRVMINFNNSFINSISDRLKVDPLSCFEPLCPVINLGSRVDDIQQLLYRLVCLSENKDGRFSLERSVLTLTDLLLCLCEITEPRSSCDRFFFNRIRYAEKHFSEKITLDSLADKFNISKYTVRRYFKRYTGMGLPAYLNTLRIIKAKSLLLDGMKIIDVALECGFESISNFDRTFRAMTSMTPNQYKRSVLSRTTSHNDKTVSD